MAVYDPGDARLRVLPDVHRFKKDFEAQLRQQETEFAVQSRFPSKGTQTSRLEQSWISQDHSRRHITDPCRNNGRLVHVALAAALVGENSVRRKAMQRAVCLWL